MATQMSEKPEQEIALDDIGALKIMLMCARDEVLDALNVISTIQQILPLKDQTAGSVEESIAKTCDGINVVTAVASLQIIMQAAADYMPDGKEYMKALARSNKQKLLIAMRVLQINENIAKCLKDLSAQNTSMLRLSSMLKGMVERSVDDKKDEEKEKEE